MDIFSITNKVGYNSFVISSSCTGYRKTGREERLQRQLIHRCNIVVLKTWFSSACTLSLLCVQENPSDRPNMSDVILMLLGRPAFLFRLDDTNQSHLEGAADLPRRSNKSNLSLNKGDDHRTWTEVAGPDYQLFSYNRIRGTLLFKNVLLLII